MELKEIYEYLKILKKNNNKDWFNANRDTYDIARSHFLDISQELINMLSSHDSQIGMLDAKKCIYRLYRDVRFSHDKTPYKTNFGTFIVPGGKKGGLAGYYLHIEPGNSFLGGGVYHPEKDILKSIRSEIYNFPEEFIDIIDKPSFKRIFPELFQDDKLKMSPKGFDKEFEHIDLLKYKSYLAGTSISDEDILSKDLPSIIEKAFKEIKPFNDFLNKAITSPKEEY
jgi:uncharacterized protein (TIGR02453 family)